jgi:predicted Zn finger-like uncharacterized protein
MNKIIQCPSCNTKFALNANQLAGIDSPKFHCSRCNTIFSINEEVKNNDSEIKNQVDNNLETSKEYFDEDINQIESLNEDTQVEEDELFETTIENDEIEELPEEEITTQVNTLENTQLNLNLPSEVKISRNKAESELQLPLSYSESVIEEDSSEIKIDWPSDSGQINYDVDYNKLKTLEDTTKPDEKHNKNILAEEISKPSKSQINENNNGSQYTSASKSLLSNLLQEDIKEVERIPNSSKSNDHSLSFLFKDHKVTTKINTNAKEEINPKDSWELGKEGIEQNTYEKTGYEKPIFDRPSAPQNENQNTNEKIEKDFHNLKENLEPPTKEEPSHIDSHNRSFKETTVLKRSDISFADISEESNDFVFNSESLTSAKLKINEDLKQKKSPYKANSENSIESKYINMNSGVLEYVKAWSLPFFSLIFFFYIGKSIQPAQELKQGSFARRLVKILNLDELPKDLIPPRNLIISDTKGDIFKIKGGSPIKLKTFL